MKAALPSASYSNNWLQVAGSGCSQQFRISNLESRISNLEFWFMSLTQGSLFCSGGANRRCASAAAGITKIGEGMSILRAGAGRAGRIWPIIVTPRNQQLFYAPPRPKGCAAWARRVRNNPSFRVYGQGLQRLSHERKAKTIIAGRGLRRGGQSMALSRSRVLGALLIQFPWRFRCTPENQAIPAKAVSPFAGLSLALEVRHGSWIASLFTDFCGNRVAFCNLDQPLIGNSIKPGSRDGRLGYFRCTGGNYANCSKRMRSATRGTIIYIPKDEIRQLSRKNPQGASKAPKKPMR